MATAIETLGMSLPYSSSTPAEDPLKRVECRLAGRCVPADGPCGTWGRLQGGCMPADSVSRRPPGERLRGAVGCVPLELGAVPTCVPARMPLPPPRLPPAATCWS